VALTITSANSVLTLSIPDVFPTGQVLQGYAVDDAFDTDNVSPNEVQLGVDGIMSSGFTPFITKLHIALQANSVSLAVFDAWAGAMLQARESYTANATLAIANISTLWTFTNGALTGYKPTPKGAKVLGPRMFEISWQSAIAGVYSSAFP